MEPLSSEEYDRLMNFGAHTPEDEDADKYLWRYHCEAPPKFIDVWLEIYEKGQLVEKCETMDTCSGGSCEPAIPGNGDARNIKKWNKTKRGKGSVCSLQALLFLPSLT